MKKVLITGGAGFIGSHLADLLYNSGYEIVILDNLSPKTHYGNWPTYLNKSYNLIKGDVTIEKDLTKALDGVNIVFHLAAEMDLNPDYFRFINTNVGSTALLFEIINKHKLNIDQVLIASTQFVYGHGRWMNKNKDFFFPENRIITKDMNWDFYNNDEKLIYLNCIENQKLSPPNHYALSKFFQEELSLKLGKLNEINVKCLRFSIIHGLRQSIKNTYSGALRTFCYFAALGRDFSSFEDNLSMRDFTPIYDAVNACKLVMEKGGNFEVFNISNGKSITVKELGEIVSKKFNGNQKFSNKIEWRHGDIRHAVSCIKKIQKLGFVSKHSENDTISEYIEWFKEQNLDFDRFSKTQKIMRKNGQIRSF